MLNDTYAPQFATPTDRQQNGDTPSRASRITWATDIEPEPVRWAWRDDGHGRIPAGALTVAAGREGTGKSSFAVWLTAHVTNGTLPGVGYGTPAPVFYVAVEDSWRHTIVPRLMAAGADLDKVGRFDVIGYDGDDMTLSLPADNSLLETAVTRHGVALVVLDPMMSTIGARIDTHREREVRSALDPLARIGERTGAVILGVAHFNKGTSTDAASLITGSGAFKNVPRSVFGFARDAQGDTNERVMTQVKNSLGRDDLPSLSYRMQGVTIPTRNGPAETGLFAFTGISDRSVADLIQDANGNDEDKSERDEATSWIIDYLTSCGGEAKAADAIKAAAANGIAKTTLTRARHKAGVQTVKAGMGAGWVWSIDPGRNHEETEEPRSQDVDSSDSSVGSSAASTCDTCGRRLMRNDGGTTCEACRIADKTEAKP